MQGSFFTWLRLPSTLQYTFRRMHVYFPPSFPGTTASLVGPATREGCSRACVWRGARSERGAACVDVSAELEGKAFDHSSHSCDMGSHDAGAAGSSRCGLAVVIATCLAMFMFGRWSAVEEIDREKVTGARTRIKDSAFGNSDALSLDQRQPPERDQRVRAPVCHAPRCLARHGRLTTCAARPLGGGTAIHLWRWRASCMCVTGAPLACRGSRSWRVAVHVLATPQCARQRLAVRARSHPRAWHQMCVAPGIHLHSGQLQRRRPPGRTLPPPPPLPPHPSKAAAAGRGKAQGSDSTPSPRIHATCTWSRSAPRRSRRRSSCCGRSGCTRRRTNSQRATTNGPDTCMHACACLCLSITRHGADGVRDCSACHTACTHAVLRQIACSCLPLPFGRRTRICSVQGKGCWRWRGTGGMGRTWRSVDMDTYPKLERCGRVAWSGTATRGRCPPRQMTAAHRPGMRVSPWVPTHGHARTGGAWVMLARACTCAHSTERRHRYRCGCGCSSGTRPCLCGPGVIGCV